MNIINGFGSFLVIAALVYAVFMFIFPFLIISKLNVIIRNQNYLVRYFDNSIKREK